MKLVTTATLVCAPRWHQSVETALLVGTATGLLLSINSRTGAAPLFAAHARTSCKE